jgi:plastocyanin
VRRRSFLLGAGWIATAGWAIRRSEAADATAGKPATTHAISIEAMQFGPASLTIRRGERIRWTNKDPFPHTVTAQGGTFDSGEIQPDKSWTFTARKAGQFPYVCKLHPTMQGTLIVT